MDAMDEATLYEVVEMGRRADLLVTESVLRCQSRGCRLVGTYRSEGHLSVHIAGPFKLSARKAEELGLPRRTPGRAWFAGEGRTVWVGCDHHVERVTLA